LVVFPAALGGRHPAINIGDERRLDTASTVMVIPLTTARDAQYTTRTQFTVHDIGLPNPSGCHCEQVTSVRCSDVAEIIAYLPEGYERAMAVGVGLATDLRLPLTEDQA